ncbi:phthalate 3,4-dioxygenase, ferredoxin reductase subunit [Blastococcus aurantiacus]|uniref:Phthalate 3,4-dioxygenase, ferredoxin reductase subunit n=1 Tax=Blastococcus aurantiacus TaxID=1550231 RepID=A0A1G7HI15_9ACTN|nr:FAD-dependent oxidoreductase [Blastococcus aurantiacus]SDF00065.1 phthalate 3,4-dioxygenase, ferredoxin reductase subunit [Blastococcus aurantiacus]
MTTETVVVVGSSTGGVRTAQALRREGFAGRIVLVGEEPHAPYDKPPLSKQYLAGEWELDRLALITPEAAASAEIELRLGVAAVRLDVAAQQVLLADGTALDFDSVVIATGAAARPSPWPADSGVHVIRTLADVDGLRADLAAGGAVVVVGGGVVGAEAAATISTLGHAVTVVDPLRTPLARLVGPEVGRPLEELHRRHGVDTRFGVGVEGIDGTAGNLTVRLTDGSVLPAATVLVGIGAVPNDAWLADSGLLVENGVVCDRYCRAVDSDRVWAVGDVARWQDPRYPTEVRLEHWTNAVEQAAAVAHNIVHADGLKPYSPLEYVWSDQYDWKLQIVGHASRGGRYEVVGDLAADPARAAVLYSDDDGRLIGAVSVNWPKALVTSRRALTAGGSDFESFVEQIKALPAKPPAPAAR